MPLINDLFQVQGEYTIDPGINFSPGILSLKEDFDSIDFAFNFDEGLGEENLLIERSGKVGLDGLFNVTPTRVTGVLNQAVVFPSTPRTYTNHGVPINIFDDPDTDFFIDAWVYVLPGTSGVWRAIVSQQNSDPNAYGFRFAYDSNQRIHVQWFDPNIGQYNTNTNAQNLLSEGVWKHVVFGYRGRTAATAEFWVDGVKYQTTPISNFSAGVLATPTAIFSVGSINAEAIANKGLHWQGRLDDVTMYRKTITPAIVAGLYNSGLGRIEKLYYSTPQKIFKTAGYSIPVPDPNCKFLSADLTTGGSHTADVEVQLFLGGAPSNRYYYNDPAWVLDGNNTTPFQDASDNLSKFSLDGSVPDCTMGFILFFVSDGIKQIDINALILEWEAGLPPIVTPPPGTLSVQDGAGLRPFKDFSIVDPTVGGGITKAWFRIIGHPTYNEFTPIIKVSWETVIEAAKSFVFKEPLLQDAALEQYTFILRVEDTESLQGEGEISVDVSPYEVSITLSDFNTGSGVVGAKTTLIGETPVIQGASTFQIDFKYGPNTLLIQKDEYSQLLFTLDVKRDTSIVLPFQKLESFLEFDEDFPGTPGTLGKRFSDMIHIMTAKSEAILVGTTPTAVAIYDFDGNLRITKNVILTGRQITGTEPA